MTYNGYYINRINCATPLGYGLIEKLTCVNDDFYNVSLIEDTWINISIYFKHDKGDLDLYLIYVHSWSPFNYTHVAFSTSYTDDEFIYFEVKMGGNYYIHVDDYELNLNYSLSIDKTTKIWDDEFEDNEWFNDATEIELGTSYDNLDAIDLDAYCFNVEEGIEINITIGFNFSIGDLDLYLINYDSTEDVAHILNVSSSYSNQEQIVFQPINNVTYYILVYLNEFNSL